MCRGTKHIKHCLQMMRFVPQRILFILLIAHEFPLYYLKKE